MKIIFFTVNIFFCVTVDDYGTQMKSLTNLYCQKFNKMWYRSTVQDECFYEKRFRNQKHLKRPRFYDSFFFVIVNSSH